MKANLPLLGPWLQRLSASLSERARYILARQESRRLAHQLGLAGQDWDLDSLKAFASLRACTDTIAPSVLIDVGAHRGAFSRAAAVLFSFDRILCIEPDIDLAAALSQSLAGLPATFYTCGVAEATGEARFHVHPDKAMNSLLSSDPARLRTRFPTDDPARIVTRIVPTETLDNIALRASLGDSRCFLKLDTQGNELAILRGATRLLEQTDICLVEYMFYTPYERRHTAAELLDFMEERHFDCAGPVHVSRRPSFEISGVDFLFVRPRPSTPASS
jgi:FkbM family methyltransferase